MAVMVWMADESPDSVISWFIDNPGVEQTSGMNRTAVAGFEATRVDLLQFPRESEQFGPLCTDAGIGLASDTSAVSGTPGGVLTTTLELCTWSRVWAINIEGVTVVLTGHAALDRLDPAVTWRVDDFEPLLDDFTNALTFCTESTPCEND